MERAFLENRLGNHATRHEVVATARVLVRNTGVSYAGADAVLVFARSPAALRGDGDVPIRELAAFDRTDILQPGAAQSVELDIRVRDLALVGADGAWYVEPGTWRLELGSPSKTHVDILVR